jgi:hypothetical protein
MAFCQFSRFAVREATLQRECVMDFLAENGNLELQFTDDDEEFDEELMAKLAEESLAREESLALEQEMAAAAEGEAAAAEEGESAPAAEVLEPEAPESEDKVAPEPVVESVEEEAPEAPPEERDYANMSTEMMTYYSLLDSGALDTN